MILLWSYWKSWNWLSYNVKRALYSKKIISFKMYQYTQWICTLFSPKVLPKYPHQQRKFKIGHQRDIIVLKWIGWNNHFVWNYYRTRRKKKFLHSLTILDKIIPALLLWFLDLSVDINVHSVKTKKLCVL